MRLSLCALVAVFLPLLATAQYGEPAEQVAPVAPAAPANDPPPATEAAPSAPSMSEAPASSEAPPAPAAPSTNGGCGVHDVLFVVDSTGSVKDDYEKHKKFVLDVIDGLNVSPSAQQIGVVLYSSKLRQQIRIPLGTHDSKEALVSAVHDLPFFAGITETGAALTLAKTALAQRRAGVAVDVIVVTDGFSFDSVKEGIEEIRNGENVRTFAAGVADPLGEQELLTLAGSEDHMFKGAESASELVKKLTECSGGGPNPPTSSGNGNDTHTQPGPDTNGPSDTNGPNDSNGPNDPNGSNGPNGTQPTTSGGAGKCVLDILFVIDASGSVTQRFDKELELASQLVDRLTTGPDNAKVALIRFAGKGKEKTIFGFNKHTDKEEIKKAISEVNFLGGTTATNEALILADAEFEESRGARPGVAEPIVIVFTDGYSQQDPQPGATKLHDKKISVYAVGIIEQYPVNLAELEVIAGDKVRVFTEKTINDFQAELDRLTSSC